MLDSIYSYDVNEVGLLYFSWVQRKEIAGNKYLSTNNHKAISYFDNHPVFTLEDNRNAMTGIWLEDISTWAKILHIRSCGR